MRLLGRNTVKEVGDAKGVVVANRVDVSRRVAEGAIGSCGKYTGVFPRFIREV